MLPPPAPFHHPNATSTPNAKGKQPEPQRRPPSNVGGMAQRTAERHATRLKAIQEAQEAQLREDEAARAAAASASVPPAPPEAPQAAIATADLQEDEYHFPSDDDALYATVDLDGLDDGIGRPIDFEEGAGAATEDATSSSASSTVAVGLPMREAAQSVRPNWLQSNGSVSNSNAQRASAAQPSSASTSASAGARPQTSHPNVAQSRSGSSSSSSMSGERARTPSMGGGFSFPTAVSGVVSLRIYSTDVGPVNGSNSNPPADQPHYVLTALLLARVRRAISSGPRISCSTSLLLC